MSNIWHEKDGIIYFSVISNGTSGKEWIARLEGKGFRVSEHARQRLRSPAFTPTNGITTKVAVLKGVLFEENNRTMRKIHAFASGRRFTSINPELACLIRELLTNEDIKQMGLWRIIAMHVPIVDHVGDPYLLCADRSEGGGWLDAFVVFFPYGRLSCDNGFAFAEPSTP